MRAQAEELTDVVSTFRVRGDGVVRHALVDDSRTEEGLALPAPAWA
jgi:methyl-accepting chemotaxis protein